MVIAACIFALLLLGYAWFRSWAQKFEKDVRYFNLDDVDESNE